MNFSELSALLNAGYDLQQARFSITVSDLASSSISRLFAAVLPSADFTILGADFNTNTPNQISIAGQLDQPFLGSSGLHVSAIFTAPNDNAEVQLALVDFGASWQLTDALPSLAGTEANLFSYSNVEFVLDSLALNDPLPYVSDTVESEIVRGVSFSAMLTLGNTADRLARLVGLAPLEMTGSIEFLGNQSQQFLVAMPAGDPITIGSFSLPFGIDFVTRFVEATNGFIPVSFTHLTARIEYNTQAGLLEIPLSAMYLANSNFLPISIELDSAQMLLLAEVEQLIGGHSLVSVQSLPSSFPTLTALRLASMTLDIQLSDPFGLVSVDAELRYDQEWTLFEERIRFHDLRANFTVINPLNAPGLSVVVYADADIAGQTLEGFVSLPDFDFGIELLPDSTIDIRAILEELLPGINAPELICTTFFVQGNESSGNYQISAHIESDWMLAFGDVDAIALRSMTLSANYTSGQGATGLLTGMLSVFGLDLTAQAIYDGTGWMLEAATDGDSDINFTELLDHLFGIFGLSLPSDLPEISLRNLVVSYNTSTGDFNFAGVNRIATQIDIGSEIHSVETYLDLTISTDPQTNTRIYSGMLRGDVQIGNALFELEYDFGSASLIRGNWVADANEQLHFSDLASSHGIDHDLTPPSGLNLNLVRASFEYSITQGRFILSAESESYGDAFFMATNANEQWDFIFGIHLNLSNIPDLPDLGGIGIEQGVLIISTVNDDRFMVPSLPELPQLNMPLPTGRITYPVVGSNAMRVRRGVSIGAIFALEGSNDPLVQNIALATELPELLLQTTLTEPIGNSEFLAYLTGTISIRAGNGRISLSNVFLEVILEPFTLLLHGGLLIPLDPITIEASGGLMIGVTGTQAIFDVRALLPNGDPAPLIPAPFGLLGVELNELGVAIGAVFEPPGVSLGLEGVFNIIGQPPGANRFVTLVELEGEVPNILLLCAYIETITVDLLITAQTGISLTNLPDVIRQLRADQLTVYWSETPGLALPDGRFSQQGFGFSGFLMVGNITSHANVHISTVMGVRGDAEMSPINWHDVLEVSGDGMGVSIMQEFVDGEWRTARGRSVSATGEPPQTREIQVIEPGGPVVSVNSSRSPYVNVSLQVKLFNIIGVDLEVEVASDHLQFLLAANIGHAVNFDIDCMLSREGFEANALFDLQLVGEVGPFNILGFDLGTIKLDVNFHTSLHINIDATGFMLAVSGEFEFDGRMLSLGMFTITENFSSLEQLATHILREIERDAENIFAELLNEARNVLRAAEETVIGIGNAIVDDIESIEQAAEDEFNSVVNRANEVAGIIAAGVEEIDMEIQRIEDDIEMIRMRSTEILNGITSAVSQEVAIINTDIANFVSTISMEISQIENAANQVVSELEAEGRRIINEAEMEVDAIVMAINGEVRVITMAAAREARQIISEAEMLVSALRRETERILDAIEEAARRAERWAERAGRSVVNAVRRY